MSVFDNQAVTATITNDFALDVARGNVTDISAFRMFGERTSVSPPAAGSDIWEEVADVIPAPITAGVQMTLKSTSVNDTSGGTGVRSVVVDYLDASGNEQSETVTMNGTTGVNMIATNVRFVQTMGAATAGSSGVSAGDITIYETATPANIHNIIKTGNNRTLRCARMVPAGKTLYVTGWTASQVLDTGTKPAQLRLRATSINGTVYEGVFNFKDSIVLKDSAIVIPCSPPIEIPALAVVKVSVWSSGHNIDVSASVAGYLVTS